jgi:hypothetical protein
MKNHVKGFGQFVNESGYYSETFESQNKESMMTDLIRKIDDALEEEGLTDSDLVNSVDSVIRQAEEHGYDGEVYVRHSRTGNTVLVFEPTPSRFHRSNFYKNVVSPLVGGMGSGHTFGGGRGKY